MKQNLTIEQSAELIKRGVSADKASAIFIDAGEQGMFSTPKATSMMLECAREAKVISPIFTLADLLSLLPNNYPGDELNSGDKRVYLTITAVDWDRWMAKYSTFHKVIAARIHDEMIDAVYELLLWAIDHNHVKLD